MATTCTCTLDVKILLNCNALSIKQWVNIATPIYTRLEEMAVRREHKARFATHLGPISLESSKEKPKEAMNL